MSKSKQLIPYGAIRSALRRLWLWSDERKQALQLAKAARGKYTCAMCSLTFKQKEVQVDHIIPIGKLISWDQFITDLFCPVANLQVLCIACHIKKGKQC